MMTIPSTETMIDDDMLAFAEELRQVVGRFVRTVRSHAGTPSSAQSETLGFLDRDGPMSIAAIAHRRNVRHQSMRLVVAQLEADGFVSFAPDPDDRRGKLIAITESGRGALERGRQVRAGWIARALQEHASVEEMRAISQTLAVLQRIVVASRT